VVIFIRWNQTTIANTTLLFIFPPNGPHGCVTITARFDLESDICAFELDSGRINFRSLTDDDDDDADDGIVLKLKIRKA